MKTTNHKAPRWLLKRGRITQRQWRALKRRELRRIISAFQAYRMGCAYCPAVNGEVGAINNALNSLKASHSVKEWGR